MRQVGILGALLAVALIGTYATWFDEDDRAPRQGVPLLDVAPRSLEQIAWSSESTEVTLERQQDDEGDWLSVQVVVYDEPTTDTDAPADTDTGSAPPSGERTVKETLAFVGNDAAQSLWDGVAPLVAVRDLGPATEERKAPFGLDAPTAELSIQHRGATFALQLGGEAFGTRDRYGLADGRVVLIDDKLLRPLTFARTRLMERSLHPWSEADLASVRLRTTDQGERAFIQRHASDRARAHWASDAPDGGQEDPSAGAWIGKLLRLRLTGWPDPAEVPDALVEVAHIELQGREGEAWPITLLRAEPETAEDKPSWWARAGWLRATVQLNDTQTSDLVADLPSLFRPSSPDEPSDDAP